MIRIVYDEQNLTLEISGHAGSAPKGSDLVCCAVSVLGDTLLNNLKKFKGSGWYVLDCDTADGELYIHCEVNGYFSFVVEMFRFVMVGFQAIAEHYPQYVKIIETGGQENGGI